MNRKTVTALLGLAVLALTSAASMAAPIGPQAQIDTQSSVIQIANGTGCKTSAGTCRLNISGPLPIGSGCSCRNRSYGNKSKGTVVR